MTGLRFLISLLFALPLAGCSIFETLSFQPDRETSGIIDGQQVKVSYIINAGTKASCDPAIAGCLTLNPNVLPEEVFKGCGIEMRPLVPVGIVVPFALAGYDVLLGAIDGYRAKLKERAVKSYGTTVLVRDLQLANPAPHSQCILVERYIGKDEKKELAMVLVNRLERVETSDNDDKTYGLTWTLIYLEVKKAAAQTALIEGEKSKIKLTQSLVITALRPEKGASLDSIGLVSETSFALSAIEIGTRYVNRQALGLLKNDLGDMTSLEVSPGALFAPISKSLTVGTLSLNVIERGAASDLSDASAAELSLRAALREAIGSEIERRLAE